MCSIPISSASSIASQYQILNGMAVFAESIDGKRDTRY